MIQKKFLIICLLSISFLWLGCGVAQKRQVIKAADVNEHGHTYPYIQSFGELEYHAAMKYDSKAGMLEIKFVNRNEIPLTLLKNRRVKALMALPKGESREFYFFNLQEGGYYFMSYDYSEIDSNRLKANDTIFAKKNWLRDLSSFKLTIWVPLDENIYELNYQYQKNEEV